MARSSSGLGHCPFTAKITGSNPVRATNNERFMLEKLSSLISFDLINGPYIIGSAVTHSLAQSYYPPTWDPNDIDIICRNEEQMLLLKEKLLPLSGYYNEKERTIVSQMFGVHPLQMIWVIDGITITASIRDHSAVEQIKTADYTVTAAATDGKSYLASKQTLSDIRDKVLRELSFDMNRKCAGTEAIEWIFEKYQTYISRGFIDKDNAAFNELNKIVADSKRNV